MIKQNKLSLLTEDGVAIRCNHFIGASSADNRTMIILPATGVKQSRYFSFAQYFAKHGWHVLTLDYRGIGESLVNQTVDKRFSMTSWGRYDFHACLNWAKSVLDAQYIAVTGHSIGGQIIPLAGSSHLIDAVIAVAAQKGYWKNWPSPRKWLVALFFKVFIPVCLRTYGYVPLSYLGLENLPKAVAADYVKWTTNIDYLDSDNKSFLPLFHQFNAPIFALSFADDLNYAPQATVDDLVFNYYKNSAVWRCHISPHDYSLSKIGHSGFFSTDTLPLGVWDDVRHWLDSIRTSTEDKLAFNCLSPVSYKASENVHAV